MIFDEDNKQNEAKSRKDFWLFLKVVLPIVGTLFFIVGIYEAINRNENHIDNTNEPEDDLAFLNDKNAIAVPTPQDLLNSVWTYSTTAYPMSDQPIKRASIASTNTFESKYPKQAILTLTKHPRWGTKVILDSEFGGLLICKNLDMSCRYPVKFDNGKTISYRVGWEAPKIVFIKSTDFISRLKKAKKLYIEISFYSSSEEHEKVLEFNVEGLKF
jgi:hypothetical protein